MYTPKTNDTDKTEYLIRFKQIILIIAIIIVGFILYNNMKSDNSNPDAPIFMDSSSDIDTELASPIIIHIKGEVVNPGVYNVSGDFRLKDAIDCAGGLTEMADKDVLNLAMFLNDGDEIIIPAADGELTVNSSDTSRASVISKNGTSTSSKVNLNTATVDQLANLPGIGKSLAEQIIQYRTHIKFNSVEDIKNVPGIGNSKYDDIRDYIYVK